MTKTKNAIVFGAGNIGTEAHKQLVAEGYDVKAVVTRDRIRVGGDPSNTISIRRGDLPAVFETLISGFKKPDVVVSAIPGGDGSFERELMLRVLGAGIPFVTAAKVALAKHFEWFKPHIGQIGRNATVGGGTMMLDFMRQRLRLDDGLDADVYLVINGTMSYFMTNRWKNRSVDAILRECVALKYAEPSADGKIPDALTLFQGEIQDVVWKLLIVLNDIFFVRMQEYASLENFTMHPLTKSALERYTAAGARYKYVVRITTAVTAPEMQEGSPGSISARIGGNRPVYVSGGFYKIPEGSALSRWVPDVGPGNAVQIDQGGLVSMTSGDGAGPLATCMSIMHDVRTLCPLN